MSLAHNGHSQLADSNTGEATATVEWDGLSPLGKQVIAEMNRLGMMVDVSHPSKGSMLQAIGAVEGAGHRLAFAGARARQRQPQHGRRDADGDARRTAASMQIGGVRQLHQDRPARARAGDRRAAQEFGAAGGTRRRHGQPGAGARRAGATAPARQRRAARRRRRCDRRLRRRARALNTTAGWRESTRAMPAAGRATVKDFVDHIDYAVKLIGIDHVGISSDFDGGGGVDGWNSAADTFNVTLELVRRGYTEEQIAKIWSGNLLRVMDRAQAVARQLQAGGR